MVANTIWQHIVKPINQTALRQRKTARTVHSMCTNRMIFLGIDLWFRCIVQRHFHCNDDCKTFLLIMREYVPHTYEYEVIWQKVATFKANYICLKLITRKLCVFFIVTI